MVSLFFVVFVQILLLVKYKKITSVMKVETDNIDSIAASPRGTSCDSLSKRPNVVERQV